MHLVIPFLLIGFWLPIKSQQPVEFVDERLARYHHCLYIREKLFNRTGKVMPNLLVIPEGHHATMQCAEW